MAYTVKRIRISDMTATLLRFIADACDDMNKRYGNRYDWTKIPIKYYIKNYYCFVAYRDKVPVGFLLATVAPSMFDVTVTLAEQRVLYSKTPRATVELLRYFIDFGKASSKHIVTCIGEHTNIKPASLKKLGFTKIEEIYRLEV